MEVSGQLHAPAALPLGKEHLVPFWIGGWVGLRAVLEAVVKRKIPSPRRKSNPRTPIVQPVAQRCTDWAIPALTLIRTVAVLSAAKSSPTGGWVCLIRGHSPCLCQLYTHIHDFFSFFFHLFRNFYFYNYTHTHTHTSCLFAHQVCQSGLCAADYAWSLHITAP
jgi:hypothetical protein